MSETDFSFPALEKNKVELFCFDMVHSVVDFTGKNWLQTALCFFIQGFSLGIVMLKSHRIFTEKGNELFVLFTER